MQRIMGNWKPRKCSLIKKVDAKNYIHKKDNKTKNVIKRVHLNIKHNLYQMDRSS
jgi:CRISPR/Cas system CSM-associated protein Csm3 (group 7 of RAMP superfamily)